MINVDISNVWTCVTLPELLGSEKDIFDAHNLLRNNQPDGPDLLGWLGLPDSIQARLIHSVRRRAEQICACSDVLVVCGSGNTFDGARAAVELYSGARHNLFGAPQVLFAGESLSGRQWLELSRLLEDKDYSLHIISPSGRDLGANVTARGLRWMMERKYGPKTKERISVATMVGTPMHRMAQEEGYELFPMPKQLGGTDSTLTAAALIPMAVAGIDPLSVLEGAAESWRELDVRAFENPAWLYAAARAVLPGKGRRRELLCVSDHALASFGRWWQRYAWRHEPGGVEPETVLLPGDLTAMEDMACNGGRVFETVLQFDPMAKKLPVEMDWKDYDGLGFLSGKNLDFVEQQSMAAMVQTHNDAGVPVLEISAGELTAQTLGELFYFFELSSVLAARAVGIDPFAPASLRTWDAAIETMGAF